MTSQQSLSCLCTGVCKGEGGDSCNAGKGVGEGFGFNRVSAYAGVWAWGVCVCVGGGGAVQFGAIAMGLGVHTRR